MYDGNAIVDAFKALELASRILEDAGEQVLSDEVDACITRLDKIHAGNDMAANGRLMAAAPDLVEALQNATAQLRTIGTPDDEVNNAVIRVGEEALRKAGVL